MVKRVKFSDQDDKWIGSNKDDTVSALGLKPIDRIDLD